MFYEIITTITTKISIGDKGFDKIEHSVNVDGGEIASVLGASTTMKFVKSGCEATIKSIDDGAAKVVRETDLADDEEFDDEVWEDED